MVQLGPWGASKVGGEQPGWPWVVAQIQVTRWCHLKREGSGKMAQGLPGGIAPPPPTLKSGTDLAWEAGSRFLWRQQAAGNVGLVGDGWPGGELGKGWGASCGGREGVREGPGSQEAGT